MCTLICFLACQLLTHGWAKSYLLFSCLMHHKMAELVASIIIIRSDLGYYEVIKFEVTKLSYCTEYI